MEDGPDTGYSQTDDRTDEDFGGYPLPMKPDPTNSAQNAFVQQWLLDWQEKYVTKERLSAFYGIPSDHTLIYEQWRRDWDGIEGTIEEIQGTYNYENHDRNSHTFSDKFPTISEAEIHTQNDPEEEGFGAIRIFGVDQVRRKVWIEVNLKTRP